jgi:multiple sugar transport system ATP-binding protein
VIYGTRPEHLEIATDDQGIAAAVVVVEPTGPDTHVFTKIAHIEVTSVFRERYNFRPGETIRLRPDANRAHLFDASTGQRLAA